MRLELDDLPGLSVTVEHLAPRPFDGAGWRARSLGTLTGAGERGFTRDGWPVEIVRGSERVVALYEMLDFVATVSVAGNVGERAVEIDGALRSARPSWDGAEIVALVQLWR